MKNELINEPKISANSLIEELLPLLYDYFIGDICAEGEGIAYHMPNGQKFIISAKAC